MEEIRKNESLLVNVQKENIQIGMFGFGCVGQGLYDVIEESQNLNANLNIICVKNRNKLRKIDNKYFTFKKEDIFKKEELDLIVELIDSSEEALVLVSEALSEGKNVISANKKLIAEHFKDLFKLQLENNSSLLYEGACAGSIPIIRTLEEYYDNELVSNLKGILNGSTNYILTKMEEEEKSYESVLKEAQEIGFAEADPWLDVAGFDPKYKTCLLAIHGFGVILNPNQILNLGIQNIKAKDIQYAKEKRVKIKLIANIEKDGDKVRAYVIPQFIPINSALYNIKNEYNAVQVEGAFSDVQTFIGKGAGSHPTGSAVLSDISATTYDYKYSYKKLLKNIDFEGDVLNNDFVVKVYIRFENKEEIRDLNIIDIEESYSSSETNYIIANVKFASLFSLYNDKNNKVFVVKL